MKFKIFLVAFTMFLSSSIVAQNILVKKGESKSQIVINDNSEEDRIAADLLQNFVDKISGCKLQIIGEPSNKKGSVIIGNWQINQSKELLKLSKELTEDGFAITSKDGNIRILSGGGRGSIYGVVTLLEDYMGVDYWGEREYSLSNMQTIELPQIEIVDNPAFRYRQSQCYAIATDPIYKLWHRFEEPKEVFAGGYWVHTFDHLLPSAIYGETNPEYYSFFRGKRHPGKASQWCLTNPEVFEIVSTRIDSIFKANPDKNIISVSQNDGNYTNCTCPDCKTIDDREESLIGSVIYFLNKLATRFPDKEFSTLAYLYTLNPPKYLKPLPNVNIMLCDIDCKREVSLTENPSGQEFVKSMKGWAEISNNIFVWDYGINFDNLVAPFPNFHILQDNIKLFKEHNVTMHFSQIAGSRGGDFSELRAYMVSKLMWNPDVDIEAVMKHFLNGYYGESAQYIYKYIQLLTGALIGSGVDLWIYDSPVSHKQGMLKPELIRRYNQLFDRAEKSVAYDEQLLGRVQRARLPLQYSELEIARTESVKNLQDIENKLTLFEQRVRKFNVLTLNERNNCPIEYCKLYRERYMPREKQNLALGAEISFAIPPTNKKYQELGEKALTDGLFGGSSFVESWIGWEGVDGAFTLDLGKTIDVNSIETDFLHQIGQWILFPLKIVYSYSSDGVNFTHWDTHNLEEDKSNQVKFMGIKSFAEKPINARYLKVEVTGTKICPEWHYGVGHPSWFFIDEVTVL